jgi:hypothetical protein
MQFLSLIAAKFAKDSMASRMPPLQHLPEKVLRFTFCMPRSGTGGLMTASKFMTKK